MTGTTALAPSGYRRKPFWIYAAAVSLMLTPIGNLLWSLALAGVPDWYHPRVWVHWAQFIAPTTWVMLTLLFLAGLALLVVRRWSWTLSLVILGCVTIYDIVKFPHFIQIGAAAVIAMILATICFALILYFSEFRKPYLNPRVRWWETSPRYRADLPISLSTSGSASAQSAVMVDISRTGVLVVWPEGQAVPELAGDGELTLVNGTVLPVVASRRTDRGYGLQFRKLNRPQNKALHEFLDQLRTDPSKLQR